MSAFTITNVTKNFMSRKGTEVSAVSELTLSGAQGEITGLLGPTGCGKSTTLRLAAGLETPDTGEILVDGRQPKIDGSIGYLTQRHTLMPWLNVTDNIGLPLKIIGINHSEINQKVKDIIETLGLQGSETLYPYELSGGMQQRTALGRLLASGAVYWLMDEPFSNVDERTKHHLQELLLTLAKKYSLSVLFVTHSIEEAVFIADEVHIFSDSPGRVVQSVRPGMEHPRNRISDTYGQIINTIRSELVSIIG